MIDIVDITSDIQLQDTQVMRAKNILSTQLGSLEYAPDLGIDLNYFLSDGFQFQNESFKVYLINILAKDGINVVDVISTIDTLYEKYTFNLRAEDSSGALIAR